MILLNVPRISFRKRAKETLRACFAVERCKHNVQSYQRGCIVYFSLPNTEILLQVQSKYLMYNYFVE